MSSISIAVSFAIKLIIIAALNVLYIVCSRKADKIQGSEDMSDTDTIKGLTQEQVDKLTADGLFNETVMSQSKSVCQIVAGNVFTYFNLIFAIFACLLIL